MKSPSRQKNVPTKYLSTRTDLSPAAEEKKKEKSLQHGQVSQEYADQISLLSNKLSNRSDSPKPFKAERGKGKSNTLDRTWPRSNQQNTPKDQKKKRKGTVKKQTKSRNQKLKNKSP
jgi:hypothetical protein